MALSESVSTAIMAESLAGAGMIGSSTSQMAAGLGIGFTVALRAAVVNSLDVGTFGVGVGVGVGFLDYSSALTAFTGSLTGIGLVGVYSSQLVMALTNGLIGIVATATASTTHSSVGIGTGTFNVTSVGGTYLSVSSSLMATGMTGSFLSNFSLGVSNAFDICMPLLVGQVGIAGSPSPIPSTGVGVGVFL